MRRFRTLRWAPYPARLGAIPLALVVIVGAIAVGWIISSAIPLEGRARVVDGDTLSVGDARVRLTGIDAPELDQTCGEGGTAWACGQAARSFLDRIAGDTDVSCRRSGRDRYGRTLATCSVAGRDIGKAIVDAGWAVADLSYGLDQAEAQAQKRGIWSGPFVMPADWRRSHSNDTPSFWEWLHGWFQ